MCGPGIRHKTVHAILPDLRNCTMLRGANRFAKFRRRKESGRLLRPSATLRSSVQTSPFLMWNDNACVTRRGFSWSYLRRALMSISLASEQICTSILVAISSGSSNDCRRDDTGISSPVGLSVTCSSWRVRRLLPWLMFRLRSGEQPNGADTPVRPILASSWARESGS